MYFEYGGGETEYLKGRDKLLGVAIAGGAIPEMRDYAPKKTRKWANK